MPLLLACAFFQADFQLPLEFSIVPSGVALHDHAPMRSIDSNLLQLSAKIISEPSIESAILQESQVHHGCLQDHEGLIRSETV